MPSFVLKLENSTAVGYGPTSYQPEIKGRSTHHQQRTCHQFSKVFLLISDRIELAQATTSVDNAGLKKHFNVKEPAAPKAASSGDGDDGDDVEVSMTKR